MDLVSCARSIRQRPASYWKPFKLDGEEARKRVSFAADMASLAEELEADKTCPVSASTELETFHRHVEFLLNRQEKELMTYNNCSYEELLKFCVQRHIPVPEKKVPIPSSGSSGKPEEETESSKKELMRILMEADENRTFPRFTELPPEMRNLIYEFSYEFFEEDSTPNEIRTPPPIAQVSRLIRAEALPLFYHQHHENFIVDFDEDDDDVIDVSGADGFVQVAPDLFALIRRFIFGLNTYPDCNYWVVELDVRGPGHNVEFISGPKCAVGIPEDPVNQRVDQKLREVIETVAGRIGQNGSIELKPTDWLTIKDLFVEARKELCQKRDDEYRSLMGFK